MKLVLQGCVAGRVSEVCQAYDNENDWNRRGKLNCVPLQLVCLQLSYLAYSPFRCSETLTHIPNCKHRSSIVSRKLRLQVTKLPTKLPNTTIGKEAHLQAGSFQP